MTETKPAPGPPESPPPAAASVAALRSLRAWGYRLASPAESWQRRLRGLEPLPPLWLRRHTGAPKSFRSAATSTADLLEKLDLLGGGHRVLDIGCGCGAMASELRHRLADKGRYVGFDVHGPCIDWCREAYAADPRFTFEKAHVASPYSVGSTSAAQGPETYRFPAEDSQVDLVLAKSVFTHMTGGDVAHYLQQIARVLKKNGSALITFFLFDGAEIPQPRAFPHPISLEAKLRWRRKNHPTAALAYDRAYAESLITEAGLQIAHFIPGYWPGLDPEIKGQDQLILRPESQVPP